jgi:hypothetical protein
MRIAVLILPEGEKAVPTGDDFRRAGFAVSDAVRRQPKSDAPPGPEWGVEREAEMPMGQRNAWPDTGKRPDTPPASVEREADRTGKSYCTSSKPTRASSTLIPS